MLVSITSSDKTFEMFAARWGVLMPACVLWRNIQTISQFMRIWMDHSIQTKCLSSRHLMKIFSETTLLIRVFSRRWWNTMRGSMSGITDVARTKIELSKLCLFPWGREQFRAFWQLWQNLSKTNIWNLRKHNKSFVSKHAVRHLIRKPRVHPRIAIKSCLKLSSSHIN